MLKGTELLNNKIEKYIKNLVNTGQLQPGDRLISERELGKVFNTSSRPVRQATTALMEEGVLEKIHGKGTFVTGHWDNKGPAPVTNRIGILYWPKSGSFLTNFYYNAILRGIQGMAESADLSLRYRSFMAHEDKKPVTVFKDLQNEVDGIILVDIHPRIRTQLAPGLADPDKPIVVLHCEDTPEHVDSIVFDTYNNAEKLVRFLVSQGHTRIAWARVQSKFMGRELNAYEQNFLNGYEQALARAGIKADPCHKINLKAMDDYRTLQKAFLPKSRPTAIICGDDQGAIAVIRMAEDAGLKVPDDLSVVGCSDLKELENVKPALTTLHLPLYEMGVLGFKRIQEMVTDKAGAMPRGYQLVLKSSLVVRQSHRKLN